MSIAIVPYDPAWPAAFDAEAARVREALGAIALRIDHNGSTSVPGLAAKSIIDIQVSVASLAPLAVFGGPLESIGYTHMPHADDSFCPFFYRPSTRPHTHHIHVVEAGGTEERRTLAFRDYLRGHAAVAQAYEQLKRELAARVVKGDPESDENYARAKTDFIEQVIATALAAGYPRR